MRLRFLGKDSPIDDSPTLYDTSRNSHLVQGWKVNDVEILAQLDLDADETCVEVTRKLMSFLSKSDLIDNEQAEPPTVIRTDHDTYIIKGRKVTDAEALAQLRLPDHETVVEVSSALRRAVEEQHAKTDA
ncbi:hypothetical protein [Pseudonocardia acaciae]|uniref:hypothetical protein n=1 Tax=Pseudonocardia acaciae TaxID=551276 RepID=UPI00048DFDF0|nr:hypothetical protein [Pseudonocardia acaciae]